MKKVVMLAAAAALMATTAMAQGNREGMHATKDTSGNYSVFGNESDTPMPVAMGTAGTRPADCPAGTFYEGANERIIACDDDAQFELMAPAEGSMMPSGEPWPEGAMMLEYREN